MIIHTSVRSYHPTSYLSDQEIIFDNKIQFAQDHSLLVINELKILKARLWNHLKQHTAVDPPATLFQIKTINKCLYSYQEYKHNIILFAERYYNHFEEIYQSIKNKC